MAIDSPDQCDDSVPIDTRTRVADDDASDTGDAPDESSAATEHDPAPIVPHTRVPK